MSSLGLLGPELGTPALSPAARSPHRQQDVEFIGCGILHHEALQHVVQGIHGLVVQSLRKRGGQPAPVGMMPQLCCSVQGHPLCMCSCWAPTTDRAHYCVCQGGLPHRYGYWLERPWEPTYACRTIQSQQCWLHRHVDM